MTVLFKKIISLFIIGEFALTALGFCGHTHDPAQNEHRYSGYHFHFFEQASHDQEHPHEHDEDHTDKHEECKNKCRCTCQGGFIGEIQPMVHQIILSYYTFTPRELSLYEHAWYPFIYHPPKHISQQ